MTDANADELIEVLLRRRDVLRSLRDDPKERHVLVDHLDASKSTIYKGVSQLEEQGLIASTEEGLRPTLFGIVALHRFDELALSTESRDLFAPLPPDAIDPSALVGAEIVRPDNRSVDRHLARVATMLRTAETVRGFSPAVSPEFLSILRQRIVDDGLNAELVLTAEIVTHLRQEYPDSFDDILSAESVTLWGTDRTLPFSLLVVSSSGDGEIGIELGEEGLAAGVIVNETAASIRWADTTFERYKRTAERITA